MSKILYMGHGSLRLELNSGTVVYIDPFMGEGYDLKADLILVTHQHHDHNRIDLPEKKADCVIWQNGDALVDGVYQKLTYKDITVEATQAYNKNHSAYECVGYLVTLDGKLIYAAGDTSTTEQMYSLSERHIDYAFLPIDGMYNMDAQEASKCAELIGAVHTIPYHMAAGKPFDMDVAQRFECKGRLIVQPGEIIEF